MKHGFTLVELSIVLVILGLLVGGIMAGQTLIRGSELRSITAEQSRYVSAAQAFRDRYFALPGDMTNATAVWGKDAVKCNGNTGTAATPGTCNGDGDGIVAQGTEMHRFWQQLSFAGLVGGSYTGIAGAGSANNVVIGTNGPASRASNAGWSAISYPNYGGDGDLLALDYTNSLVFGAQSPSWETYLAALTPAEAWNIDTKMDDGQPGYGKVIADEWHNACSAPVSGGSTKTNLNVAYRFTDNSLQCGLYFVRVF